MKYSYLEKLYLSRYSSNRVIDKTYYETSNKIEIPETDGDVYYTITTDAESRLDLLAYKFYGNAKYYWMIGYANNIVDPLQPIKKGTTVRIPNISEVSSVVGGYE